MTNTSTGELGDLIAEAAGCRRCDLWRNATQTVFGEGPPDARLMLIGEQPGDREDIEGRPFVGPAGRLLAEALDSAGIDRGDAYITNVVKHFKWEARGKRRIHQRPDREEISACSVWLDAELQAIEPEVVVLLGATAAKALLGNSFRVTRQRGVLLDVPLAPAVLATIHPSAILRMPAADRGAELKRLVWDLSIAARELTADDSGRSTA
jgi:uracil-DNA glycosylase family protein